PHSPLHSPSSASSTSSDSLSSLFDHGVKVDEHQQGSPKLKLHNISAQDMQKSKSRKEKSLNVLCDKFITHYKEIATSSSNVEFQLDRVSELLGVEKRRVYDIVNVLESVNIVKKKAVSLFVWNGFEHMPETLNQLKIDGLKDKVLYDGIRSLSTDKENEFLLEALNDFQVPEDNSVPDPSGEKREKLLKHLSQRFVQLFLITKAKFLSHDQVIQILIKFQCTTESGERTKIRRLYDIANILSSVNIIQKSYTTDYRKHVRFEWIGSDFMNQTTLNFRTALEAATAPTSPLVSEEHHVMPLKKRKRIVPDDKSKINEEASKTPSPPAVQPPTIQIPNPIITNVLQQQTQTISTPTEESASRTPRGYSSLNFHFQSPPPKRTKGTLIKCDSQNIAPPPSPTSSSSMVIPNPIIPQRTITTKITEKQPLQNVTQSPNVIVPKGGLSFKFSTTDEMKKTIGSVENKSKSFRIGEKINYSVNDRYNTENTQHDSKEKINPPVTLPPKPKRLVFVPVDVTKKRRNQTNKK
ncbi:hypothetical protein AKO1_009392, partial [Acrasis kona]